MANLRRGNFNETCKSLTNSSICGVFRVKFIFEINYYSISRIEEILIKRWINGGSSSLEKYTHAIWRILSFIPRSANNNKPVYLFYIKYAHPRFASSTEACGKLYRSYCTSVTKFRQINYIELRRIIYLVVAAHAADSCISITRQFANQHGARFI